MLIFVRLDKPKNRKKDSLGVFPVAGVSELRQADVIRSVLFLTVWWSQEYSFLCRFLGSQKDIVESGSESVRLGSVLIVIYFAKLFAASVCQTHWSLCWSSAFLPSFFFPIPWTWHLLYQQAELGFLYYGHFYLTEVGSSPTKIGTQQRGAAAAPEGQMPSMGRVHAERAPRCGAYSTSLAFFNPMKQIFDIYSMEDIISLK